MTNIGTVASFVATLSAQYMTNTIRNVANYKPELQAALYLKLVSSWLVLYFLIAARFVACFYCCFVVFCASIFKGKTTQLLKNA